MALQRPRVFFFPGMGADERALCLLRSLPVDFIVPRWIDPAPRESLCDYAKRMAGTIDRSGPFFLCGLSFGGMVAMEIARHVRPAGVILISSCTSRGGIPRIARVGGWMEPIIPARAIHLLKFLPGLSRKLFGAVSNDQSRLFNEMLADTSPAFLKWSISAVLSWKGCEAGCPVFHIHGDRDRVLPHRLGKADHLVAGAGHLMHQTHAAEVNAAIAEWIDRIVSHPTPSP